MGMDDLKIHACSDRAGSQVLRKPSRMRRGPLYDMAPRLPYQSGHGADQHHHPHPPSSCLRVPVGYRRKASPFSACKSISRMDDPTT